MPATAYTITGTLSKFSASPPGLNMATGSATPTGNIGDRPYCPGDGGYARALDASDADALAGLGGSVTGHGLYQDITAFIAALATAYNGSPDNTIGGVAQSAANGHLNGVLAPRALLMMVRDQINFMLANSPVPR